MNRHSPEPEFRVARRLALMLWIGAGLTVLVGLVLCQAFPW